MRELALIDLSAIVHRVWHSTSSTEPASVVHDRSVTRVRTIAARYEYAAICCDAATCWRYDIAPNYKANRPEKNPALAVQLAQAIETLRRDGFAVWQCEGFEADDVIATAVYQARATEDVHAIVVSSDKDLAQLVGERCTIYSPNSGVDMGPAEVKAKYGVPPEQIQDWLALMGDASDNVPGVPGVGAKTAADLLARYGSISAILDAARDETSDLKPKGRAALLENQEQLAVAWRLVSLRYDCPIDINEALAPRITQPLHQTGETMDEDEQIETTLPPKSEPRPTRADMTEEPASNAAAIVVASPGTEQWSLALEPTSAQMAYKMSNTLFNSRLFPNMPNPEAVFASIMLGRTLGIGAMTILRNVHIIEGRPALHAALIVGLVLKSGKAEYFKCIESTPEKAVWKTHRRDDPDPQPSVQTFSIKNAEAAGYLKKGGNWLKIPATMLRWRAATELARATYPDVVSGLYDPNELEDHARQT